ncbi:hypothetical protein PFISCL1PPCAC_1011, partial [Pristionchus fissidentatus]
MVGLGELIFDAFFLSLYAILLLRIITSKDGIFRTPFYIFFLTTGIYNVITVVSYHCVSQFNYSENLPTVHIFKACYILNTMGAAGSTIGKAYIAVHRYVVMRASDLSE